MNSAHFPLSYYHHHSRTKTGIPKVHASMNTVSYWKVFSNSQSSFMHVVLYNVCNNPLREGRGNCFLLNFSLLHVVAFLVGSRARMSRPGVQAPLPRYPEDFPLSRGQNHQKRHRGGLCSSSSFCTIMREGTKHAP